jgi:hypothetical protein
MEPNSCDLTKTACCTITPNIGKADRIARAVVSVVILTLWMLNLITGWVGALLMAAAGLLLISSMLGMCGLYKCLGVSTCCGPCEPKKDASVVKQP